MLEAWPVSRYYGAPPHPKGDMNALKLRVSGTPTSNLDPRSLRGTRPGSSPETLASVSSSGRPALATGPRGVAEI